MSDKHKVVVMSGPGQRYENIGDEFYDIIGDRFEVVILESDSPSDAEIADLLQDAEALVTGWGTPKIAPELVLGAQNLRVVVHAQGSLIGLPYEAILNKGIALTNSAYAYARTMSETTIGMMLSMGYHMRYSHELYTREVTSDFDRGKVLGIGLEGKTVGILGLGPIGSCVAEMLAGFDVKLLAYDPYVDPEVATRRNVTLVESIESLATKSRILTVHCGWTEETTGLISREVLAQFGPRDMLICNARMPIVDEDALFELVRDGMLYASLNLIPLREDLWMDPVLQGLPNLLLTHGSSNVSDTWYSQVSRNVANQLVKFFESGKVDHPATVERIALST